MGGHLACLPFGAITNKVMANILMRTLWWAYAGAELLGYGVDMFCFPA